MPIGTLAAQSRPVGTRGGGGRGGLVLVLVGERHPARHYEIPLESACHEDKHKAPTHPHIRPLSLQNRGERFPVIAAFDCQNSRIVNAIKRISTQHWRSTDSAPAGLFRGRRPRPPAPRASFACRNLECSAFPGRLPDQRSSTAK